MDYQECLAWIASKWTDELVVTAGTSSRFASKKPEIPRGFLFGSFHEPI